VTGFVTKIWHATGVLTLSAPNRPAGSETPSTGAQHCSQRRVSRRDLG